MTDQADHHLSAGQRSTPPVLRDMTEHPVFNLVPFAGAGWKVTDVTDQPGFIDEFLQFQLPEPDSIAVAAATIGGDQQLLGLRINRLTHAIPPAPDRFDRKLGGVMANAHTNPSLIPVEVIDPVGQGFA